MNLTRSITLRIIKITIVTIIAIIILIYAILRSLNYARGPKIDIKEPSNGAIITASTTEIIGQIERAHDLSINGSAVTIDEQGNFKQILVLFPGINLITLKATDQFERNTETVLEIVGSNN
jgi:hypothetical protein